MKYKVCSKCHTILLATTDNFHKQKRGKYGLMAQCKKCHDEYRKTDKRKEYQKEYRKTDKCKAYHKEYQKTDKYKEYRKEYNKKRRQTDKYKEYQKEYRKTDKCKEYQKEYKKTDKGQVVAFNSNNKRRSRITSNGGQITTDQWLECMSFFNWTCAYSGEKLNKDNRSLDHIVPVNMGGSNNIWNVVPMIRSLNSSKQDKDMLTWYQEQPFFSEERLAKIYEWIEYSKSKYEEVEVTM